VDRIKDRALKNRLTFPIAVDNDQANWKAWGNRYWPCVYLVDKTGAIRQRWAGELGDDGFKKITTQIDELLAEQPSQGKYASFTAGRPRFAPTNRRPDCRARPIFPSRVLEVPSWRPMP
jgi:hypothetical protein